MQFKNIIGNEPLKKDLLQMVRDGRVPHASLFTGRSGTGGLPMALAMAQYLMCPDRNEEDSCGICATCAKITGLVHPDLILSFPVINDTDRKLEPISTSFLAEFRAFIKQHPYASGTDWIQSLLKSKENKQGNITAKEVADITLKLSFFSVEGGLKILLMWLPEFMGKEGNKLLKQIEEPPEDTLFFFVSENPEQIIDTIKSRTQLVHLQHLSDVEINNALLAQGLEPRIATQVTRLSEGNYNKALGLIEGEIDDNFEILRDWFNVLFKNDGIGISLWVDSMAQLSRESQKQFIIYFINLIEHLIRVQYIGESKLLLEAEELKMIQKLIVMKVDYSKAADLTEQLQSAHYKIERNVNAKILFHVLSLNIKQIFAGKPLYL
jgi:DNA polymerase III subunit delta'